MIRTKAGQDMEEPNAEPIARAAREPRHPSLNTSLLSAASQEDTMIEYLKSHPQGFSEMPFNSVDSLILSTLSYLDLDSYPYEDVLGGRGVPVVDIVRFSKFESLLNGGWISASKELPAFVEALLRCRRFADLSVRYFVQEDAAVIEKQFCACTFSFGGKTPLYYLAFRGTDGTLAGWKEDFNLSYRKVIPSQRSAERYVSGVLSALPRDARVFVGGHSKGGNLAVYAAAKCDEKTRRRIRRAYCLDAPGFRSGMFSENERAAVVPLIERYVPRESLIGMLMKHSSPYTVVKSSASGAWQHDPFTWGIDGFGFEVCDELAQSARFAHDVLNDWLARYDDGEARVIVDAMFSAMRASGAQDFAEIIQPGPKALALLRDAAKNTDEKTRATLMDAIGDLAEVAAHRAWYGQKR